MPLLFNENQEKFLGSFENSPKVYVIHREGIFGQNAKIKFHKFACKFIPYFINNKKQNVPTNTCRHIVFSFLRGPGNFNDFPCFFYSFFNRSRISVSNLTSSEISGSLAGSSTAGSSFFAVSFNFAINLIKRNKTKAVIIKFNIAWIKRP